MKDIPLFSSKTQKSIAKRVFTAFAAIILVGSIILSLPRMTVSGDISYIDALFTSTSAICVTGLIVQDTASYFTDLGKIIILLFIQIGGLGIMTIGSIFGLMLGRKIHVRDKFYLQSSFGSKHTFSAGKFFMLIAGITFAIEFIGFLIMASIFYFQYSYTILGSMSASLFHTISAFNNAGFALYSNSLEAFGYDISLNLLFIVLIFLGGIGFPVISEIITYRRIRRFSLHAKIVLYTSAFLVGAGAIMFFVMEFNNPQTLGGKPLYFQIFTSLFQSVTARTAGFNTISIAALNPSTLFFLSLLMFIGASPGGTGGGIKTTTFVTVTAAGVSSIRGRSSVNLLKRRLPDSAIYRALTLTLTALVLIILSTIGLLVFEKCSLKDALFEAISAFGTVGLTTGITGSLTLPSKIILILSMFIGRIGISTLSVAIAVRSSISKISYPEDTITIG
jgi:trk system potassium uptake protein